ncbi:uncharacterized protein [Triticum aestivum]|uniref:uncharacterized protein isoform X2 n=1 Tax=Triticum aestivum TaxID=4565 RepID=UPI001D00E140|nr:uncharacterized protein LOC123159513 isoform X2 [Triticum aestivum]
MPPAETVVATVLVPAVRIPMRRYLEKAASAPRPQATGALSSSALDIEATSAAPAGWVRGGRTGALNEASLDVQAKLRVEAVALKRCNEAYLESRTAIRDYHNLRATAYNSKVRELEAQTAHLAESRHKG